MSLEFSSGNFREKSLEIIQSSQLCVCTGVGSRQDCTIIINVLQSDPSLLWELCSSVNEE